MGGDLLLYDGLNRRAAPPRGAKAEDRSHPNRLIYQDDALYVSDDDANLRTELTISLFAHSWHEQTTAFADFEASHHLFAECGTAPMRPLSIELLSSLERGTP